MVRKMNSGKADANIKKCSHLLKSIIIAELDNNDNAITGPKPLKILDFNMYHGLYRNVYLIVKEPIHITDPILANKPASGGVFITYSQVEDKQAIVQVQTHILNCYSFDKHIKVRSTLLDLEDGAVASICTECFINGNSDKEVKQELLVKCPNLWSINKPYLYKLLVELIQGDTVIDREIQKVGIRHQEYPYIGNEIPDSA